MKSSAIVLLFVLCVFVVQNLCDAVVSDVAREIPARRANVSNHVREL